MSLAISQTNTKASGAAVTCVPCVTSDWSQLGDFEMTTPIADLLHDISEKGIPTSKDEVGHFCSTNMYSHCCSKMWWLWLQSCS